MENKQGPEQKNPEDESARKDEKYEEGKGTAEGPPENDKKQEEAASPAGQTLLLNDKTIHLHDKHINQKRSSSQINKKNTTAMNKERAPER